MNHDTERCEKLPYIMSKGTSQNYSTIHSHVTLLTQTPFGVVSGRGSDGQSNMRC